MYALIFGLLAFLVFLTLLHPRLEKTQEGFLQYVVYGPRWSYGYGLPWGYGWRYPYWRRRWWGGRRPVYVL